MAIRSLPAWFCLVLVCFGASGAALAASDWKRVDGKFEQVSADATYVWAVDDAGAMSRRSVDGHNAWQKIPGGVANLSASGADWVWAVQSDGMIWKCKKPCPADHMGWTRIGGWKTPDDKLTQLSGDATNIWGVSAAGRMWRRPVDGSGEWVSVPGGVARLSASGADWVWAVQADGMIWKCEKPCPTDRNGWVRTSGWPTPDDPMVDLAAGAGEIWGVSKKGKIWRRPVDGSGAWTASPGGPARIAVSDTKFVWGVDDAGAVFLTNADGGSQVGKVVVAKATITPNCPDGQAAGADGTCIAKVYFYKQDYLSQNEARLIALEGGNALASYPQVAAAYEKLGLNVFAYARIKGGQFAVPIQHDIATFKKGINLGATGGNQGFFYVAGCPAGFAPGLAGVCKNTRVTSAFADISKIEMRQRSGSGDTLTQISARTWKDSNGRYYLETGRDGISIYLRDLQSSAGRKLAVDLYNNKVNGSEGNSQWTFDVVKASDGANRKDWVKPFHIDETTAGVTRIGYGEYLPERPDQWGAFEQVAARQWVQTYNDPTVAAHISQVSGIAEVSRTGDKLTLRDPGGKTFVIDLAAQTVSIQGGASVFPNKPGIAPKSSALVLWTEKKPLPTAAELRQNALIAQQEATASYYKLTSPLSAKDLNAVMAWIGEEASAATVDYCYKTTTSRPGYAWQPGDPVLPDYSGPMNRCEAKHGVGGCERNGAVIYPLCGAKQDGASPLCWQQCPTTSDVLATGQNTKLECGGIGCATNHDACAEHIKDMVFAPINMALAIVTLGLDQAAQKAAEGAAKAAVTSVTEEALSSSKWEKLWKSIETVKDVYEKVSDTAEKVQGIADAADALATELQRWNLGQPVPENEAALFQQMRQWAKSYGDNFDELTSYRIASIIDRRFPDPDDASYIKQQYGLYLLTAMTEADGWRVGREISSAVGMVDPIGVTSVIDAYAQPMCRTKATPFPDVTIIPKAQRGAPDPLIWSD